MTPRPRLSLRRQRGMAIVLAVWWLLALMLMLQALALGEVMDEANSSLSALHQTQAFAAARSGLDWGLAQADSGAAPCPALAAALPAIKTASTALPDTAWLSCTWPQTPADDLAVAAPLQCRCASAASENPAPLPPGFTLRYSRAAGSAWLELASVGCAADCDSLQGHRSQQSLLWRWLPVWLAPAPWPVAVLAGGRVSAEAQTPLQLNAPGAWALVAGEDGLGATASVQGGRWDSLQGQTVAAGAPLPADLAAWMAAPPGKPSGPRSLSRLWQASRWPAPAADDPGLIQHSGDWAVPAGTVLGSAGQPVLLRVDGTLRIAAPGVRITGLVVAGAVDISAGLAMDGALWVSGDVRLTGPAPISLRHDAAAVQAAWLRAGRFAVQRGSWKDF